MSEYVDGRLAQLEADTRSLIESNVALVGLGGNAGTIGEIVKEQRELQREVREIRAGRSKVAGFFAGLALAIAAAIWWVGSTTTELRLRLRHLEETQRSVLLRLDSLSDRQEP